MSEHSARKRRFGRPWLDLLVVVGAFAAVRACQAPRVDGDARPPLSGTTLDGQAVDLAQIDEPMVLHFWATWCGVCEAENPNIAALSRSASVLTVSSRSGPDAQVSAYLQRHGLELSVLNDPAGHLAARFGVQAYPTTFVFDAAGRVRATEVGYTTLWGLRARLWWASLFTR